MNNADVSDFAKTMFTLVGCLVGWLVSCQVDWLVCSLVSLTIMLVGCFVYSSVISLTQYVS